MPHGPDLTKGINYLCYSPNQEGKSPFDRGYESDPSAQEKAATDVAEAINAGHTPNLYNAKPSNLSQALSSSSVDLKETGRSSAGGRFEKVKNIFSRAQPPEGQKILEQFISEANKGDNFAIDFKEGQMKSQMESVIEYLKSDQGKLLHSNCSVVAISKSDPPVYFVKFGEIMGFISPPGHQSQLHSLLATNLSNDGAAFEITGLTPEAFVIVSNMLNRQEFADWVKAGAKMSDSQSFTEFSYDSSTAERHETGRATAHITRRLDPIPAEEIDLPSELIDLPTEGSDYSEISGLLKAASGGSIKMTTDVEANGDNMKIHLSQALEAAKLNSKNQDYSLIPILHGNSDEGGNHWTGIIVTPENKLHYFDAASGSLTEDGNKKDRWVPINKSLPDDYKNKVSELHLESQTFIQGDSDNHCGRYLVMQAVDFMVKHNSSAADSKNYGIFKQNEAALQDKDKALQIALTLKEHMKKVMDKTSTKYDAPAASALVAGSAEKYFNHFIKEFLMEQDATANLGTDPNSPLKWKLS